MRVRTTLAIILIFAVSTALMLPVVSASEHEGNQSNDTIEVEVGQSLTVAIDSASSEVGQQVSEVARNRQLGQASNESERAEVLADDLNETRKEALSVREEYKSLAQKYKNGEISQEELVVKMSSLSNRAERVETDLQNIEYAVQFIPKDELNNNGISQETINNTREDLGVMGTNIAKVTRQAALSPGSKMKVNPDKNGIGATVEEPNGKVYQGEKKQITNYEDFNITSVEAVEIVENEFGINSTQYEVEVDEDDDYVGYYEVEAENEEIEYEVLVDGNTGDIVEYEKEDNSEREDEKPDDAEDRGQGNNRGQGEDNRSERGEKASDTKGQPPWADYDDVEEDETEEDRSEREEEEEEKEDEEDDTKEDEEDNNEQSEDKADLTRGEAVATVLEEFDINRDTYELNTDVNGNNYEVEAEPIVEDVRYEKIEAVVNGSNGKIIDTDVVKASEEDEGKEESEDEKQKGELSLKITQEGNTSSVVLVEDDTGPVEGADILVNDEKVGQTDSDGKLTVDHPESTETEITAVDGDRESEVEINDEDDKVVEEDEQDKDEREEDEKNKEDMNDKKNNGNQEDNEDEEDGDDEDSGYGY